MIMGDFNAGDGDAALGILDGSDYAMRSIAGGQKVSNMFVRAVAEKKDALLVDVNDGCFQKYQTMPRQGNDMLTEKSGRNVTNEKEVHGSYKYKGEWSTIDRFYVSKYFVQDKEIFVESAEIFSHLFLLEQDKTYLGVKPKRSFIGPHYNGGLSDHFLSERSDFLSTGNGGLHAAFVQKICDLLTEHCLALISGFAKFSCTGHNLFLLLEAITAYPRLPETSSSPEVSI